MSVFIDESGNPNGQDDTDFNITQINAASDSFAFLANEPDLYSINDVKRPK